MKVGQGRSQLWGLELDLNIEKNRGHLEAGASPHLLVSGSLFTSRDSLAGSFSLLSASHLHLPQRPCTHTAFVST